MPTLDFGITDAVPFILDSEIDFLHRFKTTALSLAEHHEIYGATLRRSAYVTNNYRLPLSTVIEQMPTRQARIALAELVIYMTDLWDGRNTLTPQEAVPLADNIALSYLTLVDCLKNKDEQ